MITVVIPILKLNFKLFVKYIFLKRGFCSNPIKPYL